MRCFVCRAPWAQMDTVNGGNLVGRELRAAHAPSPAVADREDEDTELFPLDVLPLCCCHIGAPPLFAPDENTRSMHWSPMFNQASRQYTDAWQCNRCLKLVHRSELPRLDMYRRPVCNDHGPCAFIIETAMGHGQTVVVTTACVQKCNTFAVATPCDSVGYGAPLELDIVEVADSFDPSSIALPHEVVDVLDSPDVPAGQPDPNSGQAMDDPMEAVRDVDMAPDTDEGIEILQEIVLSHDEAFSILSDVVRGWMS